MQIEIIIDELTDCLREKVTGDIVKTKYCERKSEIHPDEYFDWKFDWTVTQQRGYKIYELFVAGSDVVQGRISLEIDGGVANVDIVESAPHNIGKNGEYTGVGGHLFAIACKISMENGCDGVVAFDAKSSLVEHYKQALHAVEIYPRRMVIFEDAAKMLLERYIDR